MNSCNNCQCACSNRGKGTDFCYEHSSYLGSGKTGQIKTLGGNIITLRCKVTNWK